MPAPWKRIKPTAATNSLAANTPLTVTFDETSPLDASHSLAFVVCVSTSTAPNTPQGWELKAAAGGNGSGLWLGMYTRQADGSVNSVAITHGSALTQISGVLFAYEGGGTVLDGTPVVSNNASGTTATAGPNPATSAPNRILIAAVGLGSGGGGTWGSWDNGFTSIPSALSRLHVGVKAAPDAGTSQQSSVSWSSSRIGRDVMWVIEGREPAANTAPVVKIVTPPNGGTVWSTGFENGANPFTGGPTSVDSITTEVPRAGAASLYSAGSASLAHRVRYASQAFARGAIMHGWVRLSAGSPRLGGLSFTFPDTDDNFAVLVDTRNLSTSSAGFQISENRQLGGDHVARTTGVAPSEAIQAERWYLIEASYDATSVTARLLLDDGVTQIASATRVLTTLVPPATFRPSVYSYGDTWHDDLSASTGVATEAFVGDEVVLTSSATDSDGTVSAYAWAVTGSDVTPPTLIGANTQTVRFTADRPMTLTVRASAEDNAGAVGFVEREVVIRLERGLGTDRGAKRWGRVNRGRQPRASTYRGRDTRLGLIAEWNFGESAGAFASTDGAFPLSRVGSVPRVASPWGWAADLTGSPNYLSIAQGFGGALNIGRWPGEGGVTVAAWVRREDTDTGFVAGGWQEDNANPRRQYGLFIDLGMYGGDQQSCFHVSKTGGPTPGYPYSRDYSASGAQVSNGVWQLHVGTYDGAFARSYLDGAFTPVPSYTDNQGQTYAKNPYVFADGLNATPVEFTVGAVRLSSGMGNWFDGQIAKLRVWNRALAAAEVANLYASESTVL